MATHRLDIEEDEVLELMGIQSTWPEHRLVWAINKEFEILLQREDDFVLDTEQSKQEHGLFGALQSKEYSVFMYESDFERMILVANLSQGMALYDKGRAFDYLLRIESGQRSLRDAADRITEMKGISAVSKIECGSSDRAAKPFNLLD